mmetsp:Transcript_2923/g.7845  ORF Transcript_2923/g.7845 Transcript_2923/m.7845 type:complete len:335 (+) Transcript_2923:452-1456(+)|eukprot:151317-Chlamydomonas_euryale.AAC.3
MLKLDKRGAPRFPSRLVDDDAAHVHLAKDLHARAQRRLQHVQRQVAQKHRLAQVVGPRADRAAAALGALSALVCALVCLGLAVLGGRSFAATAVGRSRHISAPLLAVLLHHVAKHAAHHVALRVRAAGRALLTLLPIRILVPVSTLLAAAATALVSVSVRVRAALVSLVLPDEPVDVVARADALRTAGLPVPVLLERALVDRPVDGDHAAGDLRAVDLLNRASRMRRAREAGKRKALDAAVGAARDGQLPHKARRGLQRRAQHRLVRLPRKVPDDHAPLLHARALARNLARPKHNRLCRRGRRRRCGVLGVGPPVPAVVLTMLVLGALALLLLF